MRLFVLVFFGAVSIAFSSIMVRLTGNWLVLRSYGAEQARICYGYIAKNETPTSYQEQRIYKRNQKAIQENKDFAEKQAYATIRKKVQFERLMYALGGFLPTISIGTLSFVCLALCRRDFSRQGRLSLIGWLCVFASFFWLLQVSNLDFWGSCNEEAILSDFMGLPTCSVGLITCLLALAMLVWIAYTYFPTQRLTFWAGAMLGQMIGFFGWLNYVGQYVLP